MKVLDFGLAKLNPVNLVDVSEGPLTKASLVAGTPEYIAPEQARGLSATPRTDLYCLGVMMFEMLSGTLPFQGGSIVDMLKKHVYEPAPQLSGRASNLPEALYDLVMQLLEKDPERRPSSAELVRQSVQRLTRQLQQESTVQRPNPLRVVPAHRPVTTSRSGRLRLQLLLDERRDASARVDVLGDDLAVLDLQPELGLEELHHLEHAGRVDDAGVEQRRVVRAA